MYNYGKNKKIILKTKLFVFLLVFFFQQSLATDSLSINKSKFRTKLIWGAEALTYATTYTGLYFLWYDGYPQSRFHGFNDSKEWLQIDKCGHAYSSYWIARLNHSVLRWSGETEKRALVLGTLSSWMFISTIEIFDGFSSEWGASYTDVIANTSGALLFALQQHYWKKQKILYKYSYYPSNYPQYRPDALGSNFTEHVLKDYNAQTYWLSCGLSTITGLKSIPNWLNIAVGYGADGMTGALNNKETIIPESSRQRQYYISFDVNWEKIKTHNAFLRTAFFMINCVKFPFPSLQFTGKKMDIVIQ